jgi:hypothetical protein
MKWRSTVLWILAIALPLAVELTVKPSEALSIVLFSVVGAALVALLASLIWNWSWPWKHVARQITPYMPTSKEPFVVPNATNSEVAPAIDDLLDELATMVSRLTDAINIEYYPSGFFLPSNAYHARKELISGLSGDVRRELGQIYVQADTLNTKLSPYREGAEMVEITNPDPQDLVTRTLRVQETLRELRP